MAVLGVTNTFSSGTAIVASQMNTNFDDIEAFVNTTPGVLQLTGGTVTGAVQLNNTLTLGSSGAGHDVILWGDTAGDYFWYDADTNKLVLEGTNGTTALDVSDGNVVIGDGTLTVGSDGAGEDVTFYSDTAGDHFVWDSSAEKLTITGTAAATALDIADGNVTIADDLDVDGTTNLDAVDIDGAVQIDGTVTVGVDGTGFDVKFFGDTADRYMEWDESADTVAIRGTFTQKDGWAYLGSINASGLYPTAGNHLAVGWNSTGGQRDVSFWNTDTGGGSDSFNWKQLTDTSAETTLMILKSSGVVSIGPNAGTRLNVKTSATTETELLHVTGAWSVADRMGYICGTTSTDGAILARLGLGTSINGSNNNDGGFVFQTSTAANSSGGGLTDRMVIDHVGNVGIGTTSPSAELHVNGSLHLEGDAVGSIVMSATSGRELLQIRSISGGLTDGAGMNFYGDGDSSHPDKIFIYNGSATPTMAMLPSGAVGIGLSAPAYLLDLDDSTDDAVPLHVEMSSGGTANQYLVRFSRNGGLMTNGIYCDTGTAYFGTPSDERTKRDIATIDPSDSLAAITALRPVDFRFITDPDDGEIRNGLIAQEVELVIPAAVHTVVDSEPRKETVSVPRTEMIYEVVSTPRTESVVDDDGNETTIPVLDENGDQIIDETKTSRDAPVLDDNGDQIIDDVVMPVSGDDGKPIIDVTGDTKMMEWNALTSHMIGAIKELNTRLEAVEAA
jgi:phage baseplate assembly protein gpV